jgi:hypothetical protein
LHSKVLVTTYNRPQYLQLCLEYLSLAQGIESKEICIYADRGLSGQNLMEFYDVVNPFRGQLNISVAVRPPHNFHGNTYNTLEAYKEAYYSDAEFVYLVEDDVLVRPDFFTWHEAVQTMGDYFCTIGSRCLRNSQVRADVSDPSAFFETSCDFASIGVCWRRTRLAPIIEHARTEYYEDLSGYIARNFPANRFRNSFTEQDGLIMRVLSDTKGIVGWSYVPRCQHTGFFGYNRPNGARLSLEELRETIHFADKIKIRDKYSFGDIAIVPTEAPVPFQKLYCLQRLE